MKSKRKAGLEDQIFVWGSAAGLGVLVFVLLIVLGGWGIIQAIWMSAVAFLLLGVFNYFVFASPVPPLAGKLEPTAPAAPAARTETKVATPGTGEAVQG